MKSSGGQQALDSFDNAERWRRTQPSERATPLKKACGLRPRVREETSELRPFNCTEKMPNGVYFKNRSFLDIIFTTHNPIISRQPRLTEGSQSGSFVGFDTQRIETITIVKTDEEAQIIE